MLVMLFLFMLDGQPQEVRVHSEKPIWACEAEAEAQAIAAESRVEMTAICVKDDSWSV